jgi:hypothetical protein
MLLALLAFVVAAAPVKPAPPDAAALHAGLAGPWRGTLGYRDYQTNRMSRLPMVSDIRALPDGVTVLRISTFDDGPGTGAVIITTASLHDRKAGSVTSVSLRKGRPVETGTELLALTAYVDPEHWTLTAEEDGSDNDKPALLRVTEMRDGNRLTATKEVQPKDGPSGWQFRNITVLERQPAR